MSLSVVLVTKNEAANLARTLESVRWANEIVVVDCGSTDGTVDIARGFNAKVFVEDWKGYAAQKNSALDKATGDWVLALDADEVLEPELADEIKTFLQRDETLLKKDLNLSPLATVEAAMAMEEGGVPELPGIAAAVRIPFKHFFLNHWIRWGGFYPDRKLRLFRRGAGRFGDRAVHESIELADRKGALVGTMKHAILHYGYPTMEGYLASMDRYSTLAAEQMVREGRRPIPFFDTALRPALTFLGRYFLRLGFLDGRMGILFNFQHSRYVNWKYQKASDLWRKKDKSR
jgi:glycosyltransferase involved in cell wall biosynthesis